MELLKDIFSYFIRYDAQSDVASSMKSTDCGLSYSHYQGRGLSRAFQTAVASFGPLEPSDCGLRPGGFTRLTPEVLNWVTTVTGMYLYHPGIEDPGRVESALPIIRD